MQLREFVARYRERAGVPGRAVLLRDLDLPRGELEKDLGAFEEDYQIGRFLQFTRVPGLPAEAVFAINGFEYTHVRILPEMETLL